MKANFEPYALERDYTDPNAMFTASAAISLKRIAKSLQEMSNLTSIANDIRHGNTLLEGIRANVGAVASALDPFKLGRRG